MWEILHKGAGAGIVVEEKVEAVFCLVSRIGLDLGFVLCCRCCDRGCGC